jgi:cysteine synthase A
MKGLSLGTSCGINIAGAIRLGKELGPGKTIVTFFVIEVINILQKCLIKNSLKKKACPSLIGFKYRFYQTIQK